MLPYSLIGSLSVKLLNVYFLAKNLMNAARTTRICNIRLGMSQMPYVSHHFRCFAVMRNQINLSYDLHLDRNRSNIYDEIIKLN